VTRDLLAVFANGLRTSGDGWTAKCPAHDDARSSLSIGRGAEGRWLLKCHAGCSFDAILTAAGLTRADILPNRTNGRALVATYAYKDKTGALLYEVLRYAPKHFLQRAADGSWSLKGVRRVLYRLPDLTNRRTVYLTEGEKDADRLWTLGLPATCNCGGAGKWRAEYADQLKAAGCHHVIVLPDNDPPGVTHGRTVARSCVDVGLAAKLIPLPGLAPKGDVSDFLDAHTRDELLTIGRDAPLFDPARSVTVAPTLTLTSLADLLDEPEETIEWVLTDRIPSGALVLLAAPPKTGKSTFARELAYCVATGRDFLGWRTTPGPVWLLAFQDKRSEVRRHLRRLGATSADPIRLFIGRPPTELVAHMQAQAEQERPILIVVDMLGQALNIQEWNAYGEVTRAIDPLVHLSRTTGPALLLLHHGSAHAVQREGLDAVLNSTALTGSVDNVMILKRDGQQRILSSVQRIGADLEPTVVVLNPETGQLERAGTKRQCDDAEIGRGIVAALTTAATPMREAWILDTVEGRREAKIRVLRQLVGAKVVQRTGHGGKRDPFHYCPAGFHVPEGWEHEPQNATAPEHEKHENEPIFAGLLDDAAIHVPDALSIYREQEPVRTVIDPDRSPSHGSETQENDVLPVVVPERSETEQTDALETANDLDKHCADSGSRNLTTAEAPDDSISARVHAVGDARFRRGWNR
jgi:AAA domain